MLVRVLQYTSHEHLDIERSVSFLTHDISISSEIPPLILQILIDVWREDRMRSEVHQLFDAQPLARHFLDDKDVKRTRSIVRLLILTPSPVWTSTFLLEMTRSRNEVKSKSEGSVKRFRKIITSEGCCRGGKAGQSCAATSVSAANGSGGTKWHEEPVRANKGDEHAQRLYTFFSVEKMTYEIWPLGISDICMT